jgi:endonuclease G, mitochondrial
MRKVHIGIYIGILFIFPLAKSQKADIMMPSERDREQIIHHTGFSLSYNSSYLQPSWVAYKVTKSQINRDENVKSKYAPDPEVNTRSANKKDYKAGGYLMAQFVNCLDVKQIPNAVEETYYFSNITPMKPAFYNYIWIKTEELIRLWTAQNDGFYIVCGPILADSPFPMIGENNLSVPKRYYKAIYDPKNQQAIGFIFRNSISSGSLKNYTATIDEIEKETGIDLFPSLNDEIENRVEATIDYTKWNFEIIEK